MKRNKAVLLVLSLSAAILGSGCGVNIAGTYTGTANQSISGINSSSQITVTLVYGGNGNVVTGSFQSTPISTGIAGSSQMSGQLTGVETGGSGSMTLQATVVGGSTSGLGISPYGAIGGYSPYGVGGIGYGGNAACGPLTGSGTVSNTGGARILSLTLTGPSANPTIGGIGGIGGAGGQCSISASNLIGH